MTKARDIADFKFENIVDTGTEGTRVATGTSAQRGTTAGQLRFNSDTGLAEYYDGSQFKSLDAPPVVSSISPTNLGESVLGSSQTIVITGSNFSSTVTVKIIGNDLTEYTPASITRDSNTQVTITTPTTLNTSNEPYDIVVTNISGLAGTLADALSINNTPVFSTASGSLGTLTNDNRASSNLTAISFSDEESTPTVSVTSGSIPTGLTLNSNGTWSGTANAESSDQTYNFTVTATDGSETATRNYSITVEAPIVADFLVIAGGGSGASRWHGGGGGAGGYRNSYSTETSGGGGSSETSLTLNPGTVYTITVGAGGSAVNGDNVNGNSGTNSSISGTGITTITSIGGGYAGAYASVGGSGGSGGGTGGDGGLTGGSGTANQGFNGGGNNATNGTGGGGGGAGSAGQSTTTSYNTGAGGSGGNGLSSSITGSSVTRAGGGGGGSSITGGSGGSGGGGTASSPGGSGTVNTGSGGGSVTTGDNNVFAGAGGSGVVILRMSDSKYSGTTTGSPTVTTGVGGTDTVLIFTGSGSYTA